MESTPYLTDPYPGKAACGMGFVAHIRGEKSRSIVEQGLTVLARMKHRAATGWDPLTGDGAGVLVQLPHRFFKREGLRLGFDMPRRRCYGIAQVFLPPDPEARATCERILAEAVLECGQRLLGWRDVPTDATQLGPVALAVQPVIRQLYIARHRTVPSAFERRLFVIRKLAENRIRALGPALSLFHVASLSAETIVYKGLLLPERLGAFYPDLRDVDMVSAIALVHSRFSTNTSPTWDLAQPFRYIAHNGEINTVQGNRNWMQARRSVLQSAKFEGGLDRLHPFIVPGKSDSAQFDNMLELLVLGGRSLPHAMMLMIPEAYERDRDMDDARRAFYEYAGSLMEPWDGPAAVAFSDGTLVGATLDRNGLRPARYIITDDDRVVLASEAGVLDVPPEKVRRRGRLLPGRMFLVDTADGRILEDDAVKQEIVSRAPYRRWLSRNVHSFDALDDALPLAPASAELLERQRRAFGYTDEDDKLLSAMAEDGKESTGSMGNDAPLALLSTRAPSLFDYFHQLFAQVTNPPIDPIREAVVMTLGTDIGPDGNTFEETPEQCHRLALPSPIITNTDIARIKAMRDGGLFEPVVLSTLYDGDLGEAVEQLCEAAVEAVEKASDLLVLSDRGVDAAHRPIPALLALSAVHHRLMRDGIRSHTGLIVETGEASEVHDIAALIGYGAAAVNPYLALDLLATLPLSVDAATAQRNIMHAYSEGLLKVMSKMGISSVQSYRGAQIFEAVGLDHDVVDRYFTGTPSRIGGLGLAGLDREVRERHARGFDVGEEDLRVPFTGGIFQWRRRGEKHAWNPATIAALQSAARANDPVRFAEYEALVDAQVDEPTQLRGLFRIDTSNVTPVPLDEVEPAASIARRFVSGAMSFGSISPEAHETLAIAMNRLGGRSNSGEGGEESHRYTRDVNGDSRSSAIKQVASGRFGVTTHYLVEATELQIKVAQGAKPGEGGQLPGDKVDARIGKARFATPGTTLISPPPHHDVYSIEDLAQLIYDLQSVSPTARISVKLVSEVGVGTVAAGVAKAGAGGVTISGYEGGTGASPLSSIKHAGLPWELGLAEAQQVLIANRLRDRIKLQVDGGLRSSRDVVIAALLGAEEYGLATAALIVEGCVMLRKCHLNTCSVGIATQDPTLRAQFSGRVDEVVQFFLLVAEGVRRHLATLGARSLGEIVGQVERLVKRDDLDHWKLGGLDLSALLATPMPGPRRCTTAQHKDVSEHFDERLLGGDDGQVRRVSNEHRAVGALLSGDLVRRHGPAGASASPRHIKLAGSAGQSFGAFLTAGVTLELAGEANDSVGKSLSGGRIVVRPFAASRLVAEENVIIGNTALYGATAGEAYVVGQAGERFAVRNSGAIAVVEGVGDHCCEYMTGGRVVVLGATGRNFAAGMSGGIAWVLDRDGALAKRCNTDLVEMGPLPLEEEGELRALVEQHARWGDSALAAGILEDWNRVREDFVRVAPRSQVTIRLFRKIGRA